MKIEKSIKIKAKKEAVWEVLLQDKYTRIWYSEFSPGSHAETDWQIGSKAVFKDDSKCGIVGMVVKNKPYEIIELEYDGIITDGIEDYDSEIAREVKGGLETYQLSEEEGVTQLSIACDMSEEYFEMMSKAWDNALAKIKELSES
ncbi:MAG TPA: SRPBCC domain-containing protein [Sphingobacteriaceae bacterium]|nr:SRPBCC domain-containing protein [Sphingobacteriaceae bacterium]